MNSLARQLATSTLVSGLLTAVLGALILGWPDKSIEVAAVLFGVYLLLAGLAMLYLAFALPVPAPSRVLLFLGGAMSLVLAVFSFRHFGDSYAVLLLAIWIGVGFVLQGVSEVATAITYPQLPGRGWYVFLGVLTVIAGIVVLAWPFDSITALTIVIGVWLVILGVIQIVESFQIRREVHKVEKAADAAAGGFEEALR